MTNEERVTKGEVCAKCGVEFDVPHGQPVLCYTCHDPYAAGPFRLPKAWHEEKAK